MSLKKKVIARGYYHWDSLEKEKYPYTVCEGCKKRWNKLLSVKGQLAHAKVCPKSKPIITE